MAWFNVASWWGWHVHLLTHPLVPTVVFESNGLRGAEVHATSADAPKQVGLTINRSLGLMWELGKGVSWGSSHHQMAFSQICK